MRTIDIAVATAPLAEYARGVKDEPVIIVEGASPVAALVSLENVDWETISLSTNPQFLALIERSRARQDAEGGVSSVEMRKRLDL